MMLCQQKTDRDIGVFAPEPPEFNAFNRQMKLSNTKKQEADLRSDLPFISLDTKALGFALQRALSSLMPNVIILVYQQMKGSVVIFILNFNWKVYLSIIMIIWKTLCRPPVLGDHLILF